MAEKRRVIHSKERNVVFKVLNFFEEEAVSEKLSIPIQKARKRAASATGVSLRTIDRIKREALLTDPVLLTPGKRREIEMHC